MEYKQGSRPPYLIAGHVLLWRDKLKKKTYIIKLPGLPAGIPASIDE